MIFPLFILVVIFDSGQLSDGHEQGQTDGHGLKPECIYKYVCQPLFILVVIFDSGQLSDGHEQGQTDDHGLKPECINKYVCHLKF